MARRRQGLRRGVLALGGVLLKAPVVQVFLKACKEGIVRTTSGGKQDLSIWFHAFSSQRRSSFVAWTMASQPFAVPNPNCDGWKCRVMSLDTVASKAFAVRRQRVSSYGHRALAFDLLRCRERGAGDPRDNGFEDVALGHDADHGVEGPQYLVKVPWEARSLDVLRTESLPMVVRLSPTRRHGRSASWTREIDAVFSLTTSYVRGGGWCSRISMATLLNRRPEVRPRSDKP